MEHYILSIDQGTTSTRAIIFDKSGNALFIAQREIKMIYPKDNWVEQDPIEIFVSVIDVVNEVLIKSNKSFSSIEAIGITNQRETTIVWDSETGMPIYNAIVWQSRQSLPICNRISKNKKIIQEKTGLLVNPYFSASKIRFILDIKDNQLLAEQGRLMFGTVDSWLLYKLSEGKIHATDVTNASRTMLYNIHNNKWDEELLELFNIPAKMLPIVCESSHYFGDATFFNAKKPIPITCLIGDQQASLFGQTCFDCGDIKNTYGTGCFMLMNTGNVPVASNHGLLTTIAWSLNGQLTYALEGSVFIAGAAIQWLRDQIRIVSSANDSEVSALKVSDSDGVYVVPAFVGLGTPYWDDEAKGAIFGLTRATNRHHLSRATLESIAYQTKDVINVMKKESKLDLRMLNVDGGATSNNYLMQFQADILNAKICLPQCLETTALGACYLAGLCTGFYESLSYIKKIHQIKSCLTPQMSKTEIARRYRGWKTAVKATRIFR